MTDHNPHLLGRLAAIQEALVAQHAGSQSLPSAMAGSERETFLREFLQEVFPAHRRFTSGVITDSLGKLSGQVDIAVEYGLAPSFPMPATPQRLLLAESVAVVIEVKSDLRAQWAQLANTTRAVKDLHRQLNVSMSIGEYAFATIPVIAVGYRGYQTVSGLEQRLAATPPEARPDATLVIDPGVWVGYGVQATGPLALYALCLAVNDIVGRLGFALPNLLSYVKVGDA